jgi:post-segregation antitoxin (ccd killing protein)
MRMARVNITVPDDLVAEAKARGWNISRMTMQALRDELERQHKIEELDRYLAQLDDELGPIPQDELDEAEAWADRILGSEPVPKRGRRLPA